MEIFQNRCKRQPDRALHPYELGLRLKRAEKLREAVAQFEKALHDREVRGPAALQLGACLEMLGEIPRALSCYRAVSEAAGLAHQVEEQKESLCRAGKLALSIKLGRLAERYLSRLGQGTTGRD